MRVEICLKHGTTHTKNSSRGDEGFKKGSCGGSFLEYYGTYMSSLVWRSMGSWVSLSMWKRTSKDDSVNALMDIKHNTTHVKYRQFKQLQSSFLISPYCFSPNAVDLNSSSLSSS